MKPWQVEVRTPYHPRLVGWFKVMPGAAGNWNKDRRTWVIPGDCLELLIEEAKNVGATVEVVSRGRRAEDPQ